MKKLISFFKNLFFGEKKQVEVLATEVVAVQELIEEATELVKEEPVKEIEERLAEVAVEKVTTKEIKAKVKTTKASVKPKVEKASEEIAPEAPKKRQVRKKAAPKKKGE